MYGRRIKAYRVELNGVINTFVCGTKTVIPVTQTYIDTKSNLDDVWARVKKLPVLDGLYFDYNSSTATTRNFVMTTVAPNNNDYRLTTIDIKISAIYPDASEKVVTYNF